MKIETLDAIVNVGCSLVLFAYVLIFAIFPLWFLSWLLFG